MMKKLLSVALITSCSLQAAPSTPATASIPPEKIEIAKKALPAKKFIPSPKKLPVPVAAVSHPQATMQDLSLIPVTAFNTAPTETNRSIVIKAHYLLPPSIGTLETSITKIVGTVTQPDGVTIAPSSTQVLQIPANTIELWAEEKTNADIFLRTTPIPFSVSQPASVLIFSEEENKPSLITVPLLAQNTLTFYNQTSTPYTLSFLKGGFFEISSYLTGQISFTLPAGSIVTLPAPQNATKFKVGNVVVSPLPTSKSIFLLTPKKTFGKEDPTITQLTMNA